MADIPTFDRDSVNDCLVFREGNAPKRNDDETHIVHGTIHGKFSARYLLKLDEKEIAVLPRSYKVPRHANKKDCRAALRQLLALNQKLEDTTTPGENG